MAHPKFLCKTGRDGAFYFNLTARNGQVILSSQGYASKQSLEQAIESVKKNASETARFELREASDNSPYFVLKSGNHEIIGKSEMYSSAAAAQQGIESVAANAAQAETEWEV